MRLTSLSRLLKTVTTPYRLTSTTFLPNHPSHHHHYHYTTEAAMDLKTIACRLNKFAPSSLAGSWDNVGMLVEPSPPHTVSRLLLTNDLTEPVLQEAIGRQTDMILSYHPPIFSPLKRLSQQTWKERVVIQCLEKRIAVYSPHTCYDALPGGVNDWLIEPFEGKVDVLETLTSPRYCTAGGHRLDLSVPAGLKDDIVSRLAAVAGVVLTSIVTSNPDVGVRVSSNCTDAGLSRAVALLSEIEECAPTMEISKLAKPPLPGHGPGRMSKLTTKVTLKEAVDKVKLHLGIPYVRLATAVGASTDSMISTVAVCAGSGSSVLRGVKADLWVTGEMSHHEVLDANHRGTSVILCEHSNTERGFLKVLRTKLNELFDNKVEVQISEVDCDPLKVV